MSSIDDFVQSLSPSQRALSDKAREEGIYEWLRTTLESNPIRLPHTEDKMSYKALLTAAGVFFGYDDDFPEGDQTLNLNDAMFWGCADEEYVEDKELPEVAHLFMTYGWHGILYWVMKKRGMEKAEFEDVNRAIEFIRNEEAIKAEEPNSSKRAYLKKSYTIGETK